MTKTLQGFLKENKLSLIRDRKMLVVVPKDITIIENFEMYCSPLGRKVSKLVENFYNLQGFQNGQATNEYKTPNHQFIIFSRGNEKLGVGITSGFPYIITVGKKLF